MLFRSFGRHLGFAVANVTTDEPIHGSGFAEIIQHVANGLELAAGFVVGERLLQLAIKLARPRKAVPLAHGPPCIDVEQFLGNLPDRVADLFFGVEPVLRAQQIQPGLLFAQALVPANLVEPVHRHVEFVVVAEQEQQKITVHTRIVQVDQPLEACNAVVCVYDNVALMQLLQLDGWRIGARIPAIPPLRYPPVTKKFRGGENVQLLMWQVKALGEGRGQTDDLSPGYGVYSFNDVLG